MILRVWHLYTYSRLTPPWSSSSHRTHPEEKSSWKFANSENRKSYKVHRAGAILVELLEDALHLLVGQGRQQLGDQASQGLGGDEALPLLVVDPERVLQLPLHRLHVGVLHQEGGAQLAELA